MIEEDDDYDDDDHSDDGDSGLGDVDHNHGL